MTNSEYYPFGNVKHRSRPRHDGAGAASELTKRQKGTLGYFVFGQSEATVGSIKIAFLSTVLALVWADVFSQLAGIL